MYILLVYIYTILVVLPSLLTISYIPVYIQSISSVAVLPDGRIVSGSEDKTLRIWHLGTGTLVRILKGHIGVGSIYSIL